MKVTSLKFEHYTFQQQQIKTTKTQTTSRVEEIKKAIQNGTYKIDIQKTAQAMAKALL